MDKYHVKVRYLEEVKMLYNPAGDAIIKVEIVEGYNAGEIRYMLTGISHVHGSIDTVLKRFVCRTVREAENSY